MLKKLLSNRYILSILIFLLGAGVGAIFYPSKSITREEQSRYERQIEKLENEKKQIQTEMQSNINTLTELNKIRIEEKNSKISSLTSENTQLRQKVKERIVKIITPDGTIREETVRESDTQVVSQIVTDIKQEFNEKVTSIENRWKKVHEQRVVEIKEDYEKQLSEKDKTIATLSKKETIEINKRNFGISLGYTTNGTLYSSVVYDIYGPFFLDIHAESSKEFNDSNFGLGLGIRF